MEAKFTTNVTAGLIPLTVVFTDESIPSGLVTAWEWDFGDGTPIVTTQHPTHVYNTVADSDGFTVTLTATIDYNIYTVTGIIRPTSTLIGQHVKVQGNSLRWQAADQSVALRFDVNGELYVGRKSEAPATITSIAGTGLNIVSAPGTLLSLNGVSWPEKPGALKPLKGEYVGLSATSTLSYLKFFPEFTPDDSLTESQLNTQYPGVLPGQSVIGPTTVYIRVGDNVLASNQWRIIGQSPPSAFVPFSIPLGETFTVPEHKQALYHMSIDIEGDLIIDGFLIEV